MQQRMAAIVLALCFTTTGAMAAPRCPVSETQLKGNWLHVDGPGPFEEMALEIEGDTRPFRTWLHARPEVIDASWQLKACKLTISGGSLPAPETYDIVRLRGKVLTLRLAGTSSPMRYRKL